MARTLQNLITLYANYSIFIQQVVIHYKTNQQDVVTDTKRLVLILIINKYQTSHISRCNK